MPKIGLFISCIQNLIGHISEIEATYIITDRTNWKRGEKNINLFTIGGLCKDIFMPITWLQLNKRGNSNLIDRKKLINRFLKILKLINHNSKGMILLADREFIGVDWFKYLVSKELHFVIRLREKMYFDLQTINGKIRTPLKHFSKYIEKYGIYAIPMELEGTTYQFVMVKNPQYDPKEPYIYFTSDLSDAKAISNHYLKRWKIESAFKHLKTNGFNLEDVNFKSDLKLELLMALVVFAYITAVKEGILHLKNIKTKIYKNGKTYLAISIFRMGYSVLQSLTKTFESFINYINSLILIEPYNGSSFQIPPKNHLTY